MSEVAELTVSLVSYSNEELGQLSPIQARCRDLARHRGDVICRKYAEVQHLSSMSEANYKKVMIESESIRVLCVCVALLSIS